VVKMAEGKKKKYKRYSKRELIRKLKWDLKNRYGVPEERIDHIDFESVIREGMTKIEGREALLREYPWLKPYFTKKEVQKITKAEEIEENLAKNAELLTHTVEQAERGDEVAKDILMDLVRKAIVEKDKDAIEVIKEAYDMSPGDFIGKVLIPAGIFTKEDMDKLIEEVKKVRPPPLPPEKEQEYLRVVEELNESLKDLSDFFKKHTLEDLRKIGYAGIKALLDKYIAEVNLKIEKLEQLKKELPQKEREIDRLIRKARREIKNAEKIVEGIKPYDIEQVIEKAVSKVSEKVAEAVSKALEKHLGSLSKEITKISKAVTGEVSPEELKWCCKCFYCDRLAVKFYENKAFCAVHAKELEKTWREAGIQPQWNPDDMGVCTRCGRLVKVFRCSGGLIYCLDCALELNGELAFDDEMLPLREKMRTHIKRIIKKRL